MRQDKIVELSQGLRTAFINQNEQSNLAYKPQFISNNYKEGRKVISSIEDELSTCEEFFISVAFITKKIYDAGENRALLISVTGAHVILMTGRKSLKIKGFEPVFSIL